MRVTPVVAKTVTTVHRLGAVRLERNPCYLTAAVACGLIHWPVLTVIPRTAEPATLFTIAAVFARPPAGGASGRLICKALFSIELLLGCCENKIQATVTAVQGFVLIHEEILLKIICSMVIHLSLISITILAAEKDK